MILGFSTEVNGQPTHFVERILGGLILESELSNNIVFQAELSEFVKAYADYKKVHYNAVLDDIEYCQTLKYHTIRQDPKKRWKVQSKIDFFINVRKKNMFRFAPVLRVVRTQKIFMTYFHSNIIQISVNGRELWGHEREKLALNDGFKSWDDFFDYFYPIIQASEEKCFSGKIIHWTDLKY